MDLVLVAFVVSNVFIIPLSGLFHQADDDGSCNVRVRVLKASRGRTVTCTFTQALVTFISQSMKACREDMLDTTCQSHL